LRIAWLPFSSLVLLFGCDETVSVTWPLTLRFNSPAYNGSGDMQRCASFVDMTVDQIVHPLRNPSASIEIKEATDRTRGSIILTNTLPSTYFTVVIGLDKASPITQQTYTPLVPMAKVESMVDTTPYWALMLGPYSGQGDYGTGFPVQPNGFFTDVQGNGRFDFDVDYPLVRGFVPFDRITAADFGTLVANKTPFIVRVVSHCLDNFGHGLVHSTVENWFDLSEDPFEEQELR
jgi:hypothetical protein